MSAELNARRTAAAAVAADFHAAMAGFQRGGQQPDYAAWAMRLEQHLHYVLNAIDADKHDQGTADSRRLDQIRAILADFNWEVSDRQYALEAIERIVNQGGLPMQVPTDQFTALAEQVADLARQVDELRQDAFTIKTLNEMRLERLGLIPRGTTRSAQVRHLRPVGGEER